MLGLKDPPRPWGQNPPGLPLEKGLGSQVFSGHFLAPLLDLKGVKFPQKAPEQPEESLGDR